ncbi:neutral zinc metallopeptidase [Luteibacter aegosomaticola]|uniref:KPN_02809 family neutral zinc metallopeptidase n=1 Tax=Luteibacter aegosomaticola TaxID=2911538 RepID=UPI001FFA17BB|nr:neutral zinc metallopeptidase [Luteibacter aegosomaticola]UPG88816.1 neutral zinc metallopeptidase [Luteibacter aegosomaticola]
MLWDKGRRSDNVEDAGTGGGGGPSFGGGRGLGVGGIILLAILGLVFYKDPTALLSQDGGGMAPPQAQTQQHAQPAAANDPQVDFVRAILGETEDTWGEIFAANGQQYVRPKLVLFRNGVRTACGSASSAVGPFYCPSDQKVYLDLGFFQQMQQQFHESGDFARAYVIAHEVGHHVQNLVGVFDKVNQARQRGARMEGANGLSVRQELQADCFAGVWANHSQQRQHWLQSGDIESALNAATAIGDDRLQEEAQGRVVPDSFTHGTSAQRVRWFKTGFESGDIGKCNTFSGSI